MIDLNPLKKGFNISWHHNRIVGKLEWNSQHLDTTMQKETKKKKKETEGDDRLDTLNGERQA
jgi:hypothetical protein